MNSISRQQQQYHQNHHQKQQQSPNQQQPLRQQHPQNKQQPIRPQPPLKPQQPLRQQSPGNGQVVPSMAEKLGLSSEVRELKLGTTFTGGKSVAFHTLKYDFKPASVDTTKPVTLDVGQNNMMTVTVPHLDGAGTTHTVFKGSQRPYNKECVLIIDRKTGEVTLERLFANIQVKKTRTQSKVPLKPIPVMDIGKTPTNGRTKSRTKVASGKKREPSHQLRPKVSLQQRASYQSKSPPSTMTSSTISSSAMPSPQQSLLASLPMINEHDDLMSTLSPSVPATTSKPPSHSSAPPRTSKPSSHSTASPKAVPAATPKIVSPAVSEKPRKQEQKVKKPDCSASFLSDSSSSSSSSSDSDSESDTQTPSTKLNGHATNGTKKSPPLSMPDNFLNQDLQLSESESDSD